MFSREDPSTGPTHAGLIRGPPAINQREQCILGVGGNSCLKMVEVLRPLLGRQAREIQPKIVGMYDLLCGFMNRPSFHHY